MILQRIARGWLVRSGSSARLKAVATSKMHEAKVNAENGQLTSEALTQSANTSDESLGTEEASQTHIASVEDEEVSTEEQKQATLSEEQLLKTETQPQIASANIQDKRLSKDMLAPALTASVEEEEVSTEDQTQATFSEEELLKTEKHSQIRTTNEKQLSITGQTGTDVESQIANACRQSLVTEAHTAYSEGEQLSITTARLVENGRPSTETKQQTPTVHAQDDSLQTKSKTESRNLDVGWLVDEVKGLATEDTAEVDWLVQEVKRLAKETLATAHSGDSLSEASRDALDETDAVLDAGLVRGPDSDEEDVLNAAKSGEKKTRTNDGDITTGKLDLHIEPKSISAPNHTSVRQRPRLRRKSTTPLSAPAKLLQRPAVAVTSMRMSALHSLATVGATPLELVELLERESSAMLHDKDATGNTALHWAATQGHDQAVAVLLHYKADCAARDNAGDTALHWACRRQHADVIHALCRMQKAQSHCDWTWPAEALGPQQPVSKFACEKIKRMMLARGRSGFTALHLASMRPEGAVEALLHHAQVLAEQLDDHWPPVLGSFVDACDDQLRTAMHFASINGDVKAVQALLGCGATATVEDIKGRTPLAYAKKKRRGEVVRCIQTHMHPRTGRSTSPSDSRKRETKRHMGKNKKSKSKTRRRKSRHAAKHGQHKNDPSEDQNSPM